jgi:hypothetical protein
MHPLRVFFAFAVRCIFAYSILKGPATQTPPDVFMSIAMGLIEDL